MADRIPVLLDTDPGSDIDDALALTYLLRQPRCELLGITTVTGDVAKRAAIMEIVCRAYGREDVPIHLGLADTVAHGVGQPNVPHYNAIAHLPHRMDRPANEAIEFLRDTIHSRPGEIVLLSIGPFGNLATLLCLDPEIPSLLRGIVSMGGRFFSPGHEWNCHCDPAATVAAIKRTINHTLIGLDVTMQCQMPSNEARERYAQSPHDVLARMVSKWSESAERVTYHDPLAAAVVFEPSLCRYRTGQVTVNYEDGMTHFSSDSQGPHRVASEVDAGRFFQHYFSVLNRE